MRLGIAWGDEGPRCYEYMWRSACIVGMKGWHGVKARSSLGYIQ